MKKTSLHILAELYLFWLIFIFFYTEMISYLHFINRGSIILGNLLFILLFVFKRKKELLTLNFNFKKKILLFLAPVLILTFIQGFFSAPNTTDSMTYHINRIMYWIQNQTVSQNFIKNSHDFMPPFGEYILLHLYFFTGNDLLLFLSQWLAFILSIYLSGKIAQILGAEEKARNYIMVLSGLLPMGVMQASSTQVDMVTNVLALFALFFVLKLSITPNFKDSTLLGIITGLGLQVKSPFIFYIFIPLGLLGLMKIKKLKKEFLILLPILIIALLLQLRYYHQNVTLYGNISGQSFSGSKNTYVNERFDLPALTSNIIKNLMNHLPLPIVAPFAQSLIVNFHNVMGIDIDEPKTSYFGHKFQVLSVIYPQEDIVSNPIHLILIILAAIFLFRKNKEIKNLDILKKILFLSLISFLIFCFILKWEPYHPRLQMPYFIFGSIAAVLIILKTKFGEKILKYSVYLSFPLAVLLILLNVLRPFVSYNFFYSQIKSFAKPMSDIPEAFYIEPRTRQYFNSRPYYFEPYNEVTDLLAQETKNTPLVLNIREDEFEYPFWVMLKEKGVKFKVIPLKDTKAREPIITTSNEEFAKNGYETQCFQTNIEYGYVCLSLENKKEKSGGDL